MLLIYVRSNLCVFSSLYSTPCTPIPKLSVCVCVCSLNHSLPTQTNRCYRSCRTHTCIFKCTLDDAHCVVTHLSMCSENRGICFLSCRTNKTMLIFTEILSYIIEKCGLNKLLGVIWCITIVEIVSRVFKSSCGRAIRCIN